MPSFLSEQLCKALSRDEEGEMGAILPRPPKKKKIIFFLKKKRTPDLRAPGNSSAFNLSIFLWKQIILSDRGLE